MEIDRGNRGEEGNGGGEGKGREGKGGDSLDIIEPDGVVLGFHEHTCGVSRSVLVPAPLPFSISLHNASFHEK